MPAKSHMVSSTERRTTMKFQFKIQGYQTEAVEDTVNVFRGQPERDPKHYRRDVGKMANGTLFGSTRNVGAIVPSSLLYGLGSRLFQNCGGGCPRTGNLIVALHLFTISDGISR